MSQEQIQSAFSQAVAAFQQGRAAEAEAGCEAVLAQSPDHIDAMHLLSILALQSGRLDRGIALSDRIIALNPNIAEIHSNRGNALRASGRPEAALASFDRAIALKPSLAAAHANRANTLRDLGRLEDSLAASDAALALNAAFPEAHNNRGNALYDLRRLPEALAAYDAAIALRPNYAEAYGNRSNVLRDLGRVEDALAAAETAAALNPHLVEPQTNQAAALLALRRADEALAVLDGLIARRPDSAQARWNKGLVLLQLGRYAEGWALYEERWSPELARWNVNYIDDPALRARIDVSAGRADVTGRKVLVVSEQGVGDQIMFAGMLPELAADAASLTCLCDPRMRALLARSMPNVRFTSEIGSTDAFDVVLSLGSLGRLYRDSSERFTGAPYLQPAQLLVDHWRDRLCPKTTRLRVGLSWRGGEPGRGGEARSMTLAALRPLLERDDVEFVSLQYGDVAEEIAQANATLARPIRVFPAAEIENFDDLAALARNLDLVVSVQTAIIHLCGAIGAPALVMVPSAAEWRYGFDGEAMPWYGSVRLLRQPAPGQWAPVIAAVGRALDAA